MTEVNELSFLSITEELAGILPCCGAFFGERGNLLGCTDRTRTKLASQIMRQCLSSPEQAAETATSYGCLYAEMRDDRDALICRVLLLDAAGRDELVQPVRSVIRMSLEIQEIQNQILPEQKEHFSFLYELLSVRSLSRENLRARAMRLRYVLERPRVAILFQVAPETGAEREQDVTDDFNTDEVRKAFTELISGMAQPGEDDIGDYLNTSVYVLLKQIPKAHINDPKGYLETPLRNIIRTMKAVTGIQLRVCVGSPYSDLMEMYHSYEEAMFLSRHYDILSSGKEKTLYIESYIYDYLISLTGEDYYSAKHAALIRELDRDPVMKTTLVSLSAHHMNLQAAALSMGIHRNTMEKRYEKIRNHLRIHPAVNDRDRIAVRQYVIGCRKKRILRAGGIIQNNNVYNTIYRKLAERLAVNSGGQMELDFHTIGFSGYNQLLFEYLKNGEFDICVSHVDALVPYLGKQISIVNAPFLFEDASQALQILNGPFLEEFMGPLRQQGSFVPLAIWSMGWRYFSSAEGQRVSHPGHMKGKRVRIMYKPLVEDYITHLGATPLELPYNRISAAFADGMIDMQENPYRNFHEMHFHQYQKYLLEMDMLFDSNIVLSTSRFLSQITGFERDILKKSMEEAVRFNRESFLRVTADRRPKILENGVQIIHPSAEEEEAWKQSGLSFIRNSSYNESYRKIEEYKKRWNETGGEKR